MIFVCKIWLPDNQNGNKVQVATNFGWRQYLYYSGPLASPYNTHIEADKNGEKSLENSRWKLYRVQHMVHDKVGQREKGKKRALLGGGGVVVGVEQKAAS